MADKHVDEAPSFLSRPAQDGSTDDGLRRIIEETGRCVLCGNNNPVGAYKFSPPPKDRHLYTDAGNNPMNTGTIYTGLCESCAHEPDEVLAVEIPKIIARNAAATKRS